VLWPVGVPAGGVMVGVRVGGGGGVVAGVGGVGAQVGVGTVMGRKGLAAPQSPVGGGGLPLSRAARVKAASSPTSQTRINMTNPL
jgi:hypothetical protein